VFLTNPGWHGSSGLGLSRHPAGGPVASVTDAIAGIVGAAVAAYLRDHPEVLDQAAQARARAEQARAQRSLELLATEITAAEQHLDGPYRKQEQLRAIASGARDDQVGSGGGTPLTFDQISAAGN
jgi:hypothetical protein